MILKRYGAALQSVMPNFDPHAMNEIGFQKSEEYTVPAEEFEARYEQAAVHELTASADGEVQSEVEAVILNQLRESLDHLLAGLNAGELLVIESEAGRDYPKMRETVKTKVLAGANRMHFHRTVDPPLRVAVYRPRQS